MSQFSLVSRFFEGTRKNILHIFWALKASLIQNFAWIIVEIRQEVVKSWLFAFLPKRPIFFKTSLFFFMFTYVWFWIPKVKSFSVKTLAEIIRPNRNTAFPNFCWFAICIHPHVPNFSKNLSNVSKVIIEKSRGEVSL